MIVAAVAALAAAALAPPSVTMQFQDFSPGQLDVLPGTTVEWSNASERTHTVTADDGAFDSGDVDPGAGYAQTFADPGLFAYHCRIHAGMVGEVDVRRIILDPLPPAAVPAGDRVEVTGRTADPGSPVIIEQDTGAGFHAVAHATPAPDGSWATTLTAVTPGDVRALTGADASQTRRLLVSDRKVSVRAIRGGVEVSVTPADPRAQVRIEVDLRERFGWWPSPARRLDYLSRAEFRLPRGLGHRLRVRAALVDRDGWTALATSPVLRVRV